MSTRHVVVDGSNIATEGRSLPSLAQLDEAVREFRAEHPDDVITVVVDATFGHRIDESEVEAFKDAEAHGEVVSPPAGAIGRGDAFLLRIAERVGATVLSNDSFQEFHGEHDWLFDKGRLIGGKPVPGVGWIFTPRTPVRGPKSREAVKVAKRAKKAASVASEFSSLEQEVAARRSRGGRPPKKVASAIAMAVEEAVEPEAADGGGSGRRRRRRSGGGGGGGTPPAEPLNAPLTFIEFVSSHRPGSSVTGLVDRFSSHGAFVKVGEALCYVPLSAMGSPPPRAAREVLSRGETREFVVQALDPPRRGIELALPGFAVVAAGPTDETVEEEIAAGHEAAPAPAKRSRSRKKAAAALIAPATPEAGTQRDESESPAAAKKAAATTKAAKKAVKRAVKKQATAKKAPAKKAAPAAKAAPKKAPAAKKAAASKAPAAKKAAKAAAAPKKAPPAKKAAARKAVASKKAAAKKAPAKKR
jgi:Zc3h12a-like Ribonuclease NYN domain